MPVYENCYRCGHRDIATYNIHTESPTAIKMVKMGWDARGANQIHTLGRYRCRDRKACDARIRVNKRKK
jgi:hypothetical protein